MSIVYLGASISTPEPHCRVSIVLAVDGKCQAQDQCLCARSPLTFIIAPAYGQNYFYAMCEKLGSERWSNFLKFAQLVSGPAGILSYAVSWEI